MPAVIDPVTGLELYELSHRWGMYTPIFPGYEEIKLERITHHAKQGVMTHKITTIFHTSTHLNAPIHLVPGAAAVGDLELQKFFGTGVVLSIPKKKWQLIEPSDLERAKPDLKRVRYGVIGLGDRTYAQTFCFGGRRFDALLRELGARRIGEPLLHDASAGTVPEDVAIEWARGWIDRFRKARDAA